MTQAVTQLFHEDRTTWWEALHRAQRGETPTLVGPQGPDWLRRWVIPLGRPLGSEEGLGVVPRTGGAERRTTLVEEAIRQFGREGYGGASLDDIAGAVGVRSRRSCTTSRRRTPCSRRASRRPGSDWPR